MKKFLSGMVMIAVFSLPCIAAADGASYGREGSPVAYADVGTNTAFAEFTPQYTGNAAVAFAAYDSQGLLDGVTWEQVPVTQGEKRQCVTSVSVPKNGSAQVMVLNPTTLEPLLKTKKLNAQAAAEPNAAVLTIGETTYYGTINRENKTIVFDVPTRKRMDQKLENMAVSPSVLAAQITRLTPTFTFAAEGVTYNADARDFTNPQTYTFTDAAGESVSYSVAVRESILQRSHQFAEGSNVLINPTTKVGGSTKTRHGAPQTDGTKSGSGIWYLDGFAYSQNNGAYVTPYVRDETSSGYLTFATDEGLSSRVLKVIKDKEGDFALYSAGGSGEYQNISAARSDLKFKTDSLTGGALKISFGKNLFSLTLEAIDTEYVKVTVSGSDDACQIIRLGQWYDLTFINTSHDGGVARGEFYINGSFLGNFEMQEKYCFSLREHIRFAFDQKAKGSIALDSWRVTYSTEDLSAEIEKAFAAHVDQYDASVLEWIGSMYDKDTGGFYYSASARDTEGYQPDLESTKQIMQMIEGLDCGSDDITAPNTLYTEEMRNRVVQWTQGLQSEEDGYFYHPQWEGIINPSRLGRDTVNALSILGRFDAKPLYKTATERLKEQLSEQKAARTVRAAATVPEYPTCLESESSYLAWLNSFDWEENPYAAGQNVCSVAEQIKAAGYGEITVTYLLSKQNSNNGVWGKDNLYEENPVRAAGAVMKISCALRDLGSTTYPYADKAIQTIVPWILNDDEAQDATYLFNIWKSLSNIKRCLGYDIPKQWTEKVYRNLPEMIAKTTAKNAAFKEADGAYSYYKGKTAASMFGCSVAVSPAKAESDANATLMCTVFLTEEMRNICGLTDSYEFFERSEFEKLKTTLQNAASVVKK